MHAKKPFFTLLALSAVCALFTAGLHAQLIEPTRSLKDVSDGTGLLNVLSEPPGKDVQLDGKVIGKTPLFSAAFRWILRPSPPELRVQPGEAYF